MESLRPKYDGIDLSTGVLRRPFPPSELVEVLRHQLIESRNNQMKFGQTQYRRRERAIELFGEFLTDQEVVNPAEIMLDNFLHWLVEGDEKKRRTYWNQLSGLIRVQINELPAELLVRPLLDKLSLKTATRMNFLTSMGTDIINEFLCDGRITEGNHASGFTLTTDLLKESVRQCETDNILSILRYLGLNDPRELDANLVEEFIKRYDADGKRDTAIHILCDIRGFYRNLAARKHIQKSPLSAIKHKPHHPNEDYVPPEELVKLEDLSTVNWKDFMSVRNRLISFGMMYDFALRNFECSMLDYEDIRFNDGEVILLLPGSKQKGRNKRDCEMINFFESTLVLMTRYLPLRWTMGLREGPLFCDQNGRRLGTAGIRGAVADECGRLGIRTFEGNHVRPHRLRHSMGTVNAGSLNLGLDVFEIASRLRHEDLRLVHTTYVARNRLIQRQRHRERVRQYRAQRKHDPKVVDLLDTDLVDEKTALQMLSHLGVKQEGLVHEAQSKGTCIRNADSRMYAMGYIKEMANNWLSKHEACGILNLSLKQYGHWVNQASIKTRLVGKASLIQIVDVMTERRCRKVSGDN